MARYNAFLSYSRSGDGRLAAALQQGLEKFAKPWYRRRALRIFRDKTALPPGDSLPGAIQKALAESDHFLLLASPESSEKKWVRWEISRWLEDDSKGSKPLIVLTDGEILWDESRQNFDWSRTTAIPKLMSKTFREEPIWTDLSWAAKPEHLSIHHPEFRDIVAELASILHGVPKDDIAGQDVREHKKTLTIAWSAVTMLVVLTISALVAAYVAVQNRNQAVSRQLAAQSINVRPAQPDLALLLGAEAVATFETAEARDALIGSLQGVGPLQTLLHDAGPVRHLAFSPDGSKLASAASQARLDLWSVESGRRELSWSAGETPRRIAFSADGRSLLTTTAAGTTVWDLEARPPIVVSSSDTALPAPPEPAASQRVTELIATIEQDTGRVRKYAVSPDGAILAASDGKTIALWDLSRPPEKRRQDLAVQSRYVRSLAFSPDGQLLASGSSSGSIALWHIPAEPLVGKSLHGHSTSANAVAFSSDGKLLASGGYNGDVRIWSVPAGEPVGEPIQASRQGIRTLRFSPDGQRLLTIGSEASLWNVATGERIGKAVAVSGSASAVDPRLQKVAWGDNAGYVRFATLADGKTLESTDQPDQSRTLALAFHPERSVLASAGNGRRIVLWDSATGRPLPVALEAHRAPISDLAFNADGTILASYDSQGTLYLWDWEARVTIGRPLQRKDDYAAASAMSLAPGGKLAATSAAGGVIDLWDVETWRPLGRPFRAHPGNVIAMAFSPDGDRFASSGLGGTVILWDLRSSSWLLSACRKANRAFSPSEKQVYLGLDRDDSYRGPCGQ
jgi:WD40 repeat protein